MEPIEGPNGPRRAGSVWRISAPPARFRRAGEDGMEAPMRAKIRPPTRAEFEFSDDVMIRALGVADRALEVAVADYFRDTWEDF